MYNIKKINFNYFLSKPFEHFLYICLANIGLMFFNEKYYNSFLVNSEHFR